MTINQLAKEVHENAVAHGWWDEERSFDEIIALIHSELSEALEEYRNKRPNIYYVVDTEQADGQVVPCIRTDWGDGSFEGEKPEGIITELADTVIRILDYCGRRNIDIGEALDLRRAGNDTYTLPELVAKCHYLISMAYADAEPRSLYFAECISLIDFWCKENGTDLALAIDLKHSYNKTRPYRHGGKII